MSKSASATRRETITWRKLRGPTSYLGAPLLFYVVFLVLPYVQILKLSLYSYDPTRLYKSDWTLSNYTHVVSDPFYLLMMVKTLLLGVAVTLITIVMGFPLAVLIVNSRPAIKSALMVVALSPLLINLVVRTYAWLVLLGDAGVINRWLQSLGIISHPLPLGGNELSVIIGLVHLGLPYMTLSLVSVLERIDPRVLDAATSLGSSEARILRKLILPLALPGIGAGSLLVFSFTVSAFVTPALLGGNRVTTISTLIYEKFTFSLNWPVGATLVVCLLCLNAAVMLVHGRIFRATDR